MTDLSKLILSFAAASAMIGCVADDGTDPDPTDMTDDGNGGGDDDGSGMQTASCGDHTCSSSESNASCPADCPAAATCGDGTCSGSESATSCATDCGPQTCTSSPDSCTGDNVCVSGSCVAAYGRVYKLYVYDGKMPGRDANNAFWDYDVFSSPDELPDSYVELFLNGAEIGTTAYKSDTVMPMWNEAKTISVAAGSKIDLKVWDSDTDFDALMFSCTNVSLTADVLRKHDVSHAATCALSTNQIRYFFVPQ